MYYFIYFRICLEILPRQNEIGFQSASLKIFVRIPLNYSALMHNFLLGEVVGVIDIWASIDWLWRFKKKCRLFKLSTNWPNYLMVLGNRLIIYSIRLSPIDSIYHWNFKNTSRRLCKFERNERSPKNIHSQGSCHTSTSKSTHLF